MDALSSAEIYNPAVGKWGETGSLKLDRYDHAATLLNNGQVLVTGSYFHSNSDALSSAELYNPESGKWSMAGKLNTERFGHTATLLPSGKVLIVGGFADNVAEIYDPFGK
jgi:N-acetylneuraminic acid mutarotase